MSSEAPPPRASYPESGVTRSESRSLSIPARLAVVGVVAWMGIAVMVGGGNENNAERAATITVPTATSTVVPTPTAVADADVEVQPPTAFDATVSEGSVPGATIVTTQRSDAEYADQIVAALEEWSVDAGSYVVEGTGWLGSGAGWSNRTDGPYENSVEERLIVAGHLQARLAPAESDPHGVLIQMCKDRVGVFAPSDLEVAIDLESLRWWNEMGCERVALDEFGLTYLALSEPLQ